jgi:hypothetical protein
MVRVPAPPLPPVSGGGGTVEFIIVSGGHLHVELGLIKMRAVIKAVNVNANTVLLWPKDGRVYLPAIMMDKD